MVATIYIRVEGEDLNPPSIRDALAGHATDTLGLTVVSASEARDTTLFQVVGVNISTGEPFSREVEAESASDAREIAAPSEEEVVAATTTIQTAT